MSKPQRITLDEVTTKFFNDDNTYCEGYRDGYNKAIDLMEDSGTDEKLTGYEQDVKNNGIVKPL